MKDQIAAIKAVRAKRDLGVFANHFVFQNGHIYCSDGRYAAAISCSLVEGLDRVVPGDEIERLIGRLPGDPVVTSDDGSVTLRSGRMHGTIATSASDTMTIMAVPAEAWVIPPPGLVAAMKIARPFVADQAAQAYATCLGLRAGGVVATANVSLIEVACPALECSPMLLPAWAADFVIAADGDLTGAAFADNFAAFRWASGLWMKTQLVTGAMPASLDNLLAGIPDDLPIKIDREWRKAYEAVAGISEGVITVEPKRVVGGHGKSRVEHETEDSGATGPVRFNPRYLDAVVACAETWDPNAYPKPVPFRGAGVKGLIVGRRE